MNRRFEAVVVGASAGGINALIQVLGALPATFPLPVMVVQHVQPNADSYLAHILNTRSALHVKEADEKEPIMPGCAYTAPPGYHLLVEEDHTFSLSLEGPVNFARPAVDVLFDSAVAVYRGKLIGIILTGANSDGALGLKAVKDAGGYAVAQSPEEAEVSTMPAAAIAATQVDAVLPLRDIGPHVLQVVNRDRSGGRLGGRFA